MDYATPIRKYLGHCQTEPQEVKLQGGQFPEVTYVWIQDIIIERKYRVILVGCGTYGLPSCINFE